MLKIIQAESAAHYRAVRELISEYIAWDSELTRQLGLDVQVLMDFQYYQGAEEIPGVYAPPAGCILLAAFAGEIAGCGAFRALNPDACEMKRFYVRPAFRGKQVGRRLALALIERALGAGYRVMRLETVTFMKDALNLYSSLGFKVCEPYSVIPEDFQEITVFIELDLQGRGKVLRTGFNDNELRVEENRRRS